MGAKAWLSRAGKVTGPHSRLPPATGYCEQLPTGCNFLVPTSLDGIWKGERWDRKTEQPKRQLVLKPAILPSSIWRLLSPFVAIWFPDHWTAAQITPNKLLKGSLSPSPQEPCARQQAWGSSQQAMCAGGSSEEHQWTAKVGGGGVWKSTVGQGSLQFSWNPRRHIPLHIATHALICQASVRCPRCWHCAALDSFLSPSVSQSSGSDGPETRAIMQRGRCCG